MVWMLNSDLSSLFQVLNSGKSPTKSSVKEDIPAYTIKRSCLTVSAVTS